VPATVTMVLGCGGFSAPRRGREMKHADSARAATVGSARCPFMSMFLSSTARATTISWARREEHERAAHTFLLLKSDGSVVRDGDMDPIRPGGLKIGGARRVREPAGAARER